MSVARYLAGLIVAATLVLAGPGLAGTAHVTFVLVNDIYEMADEMMPDGQRRGGFARLAAVVKAERAKGAPVIVAHAGDTLSPSLMSSIDRGGHIVALTNMIAPDIFAPGNHEFDFGKATFLQRMDEGQFPLFGANLRDAGGRPLAKFKDRSIVDVSGVRIGLTGAAYDGSPRVSSPQDLIFHPTVATITEQAQTLRREGADFVVAVVHATREQDYEIFATRGVDLLLSGHNHDLFIEFDGRNAIVESSHDAHYVSIIDVAIEATERNGQRSVHWWPQFRIIDTATVTPDPQAAAAVAKYEQTLSKALDVRIGTTTVELDSRVAAVRTGEAAIGDLIADAMRAVAKADAALMNGGSIRGGKIYAPGATLTRRDIVAELPFDNRIVTMELSGADLRRAIESGLSAWPRASGRFPQVSGIDVIADGSRAPGARIVSIAVGGAPLDETRIYKLATNDFLANGGDDYVTFRDGKELLPPDDSPLLSTAVIDYISKIGSIHPSGGRIVVR